MVNHFLTKLKIVMCQVSISIIIKFPIFNFGMNSQTPNTYAQGFLNFNKCQKIQKVKNIFGILKTNTLKLYRQK